VYEEENDGFVFSRKKSTRTRAKQTIEPEPLPVVTITKQQPAQVKPSPPPPPTSEEIAPKRRRSARLSGDADHDSSSTPAELAPKPIKPRKLQQPKAPPALAKAAAAERSRSPDFPANGLHVGKKRNANDGMKIALPFADTPVIKRNKEMRAQSRRTSSQNRRSSTALRGRRASSLMESGNSNGRQSLLQLRVTRGGPDSLLMRTPLRTILDNTKSVSAPARQKTYGSAGRRTHSKPTPLFDMADLSSLRSSDANHFWNYTAVPHADVDQADFYKLIEDGLPERRRMRQLLVWCATRSLLEKPQPSKGRTTLETIAIESGKSQIGRWLGVSCVWGHQN
jgi:kinetochore protein Mis13/DSN1